MSPHKIDPRDIRDPAVAGAFYPAERGALRKLVSQFLEKAEPAGIDGDILALVSPHAGYVYSGQVAAAAYRQVQGQKYDAVIVIAPSHAEYFSGVSVYDRGGYQTPLGLVPVDDQLARAIVQQNPLIQSSDAGHRSEHSLEVQLPFLQECIPDLKIVPVVMADRPYPLCERLARAITGATAGKKILIVASSDLYHGNSYRQCVEADTRTLEAIEAFDPQAFCLGLSKETYQACGGGPIAVALLAARERGADRARVIARTNSNDVMGERSGYCVGYAAVAIYTSRDGIAPQQETESADGLSEQDKAMLLSVARSAIEQCVTGNRRAPAVEVTSGILKEQRGAFVTITKHGQLRGCIGYIEPIKPLHLTVQEMAEAAALHDPRFSPVTVKELKDLTIEISALTPLRKIRGVDEILVGRHGLYIRAGHRSGLLLPQVATEYGWDRTTFLEHTCMKAGLPTDAWQEKETETYIFSADVFSEREAQ